MGYLSKDKGLRVDSAKRRAMNEMPHLGQSRSIGYDGTCTVPQQVHATADKLPQTIKRTDAERHRVGVGQCTANINGSSVKVVSSTPVFRYKILKDEVTLQCDTYQCGLGAELFQNGQPVAHESRILSVAKKTVCGNGEGTSRNCFSCQRFDTYVYGPVMIRAESDYKP